MHIDTTCVHQEQAENQHHVDTRTKYTKKTNRKDSLRNAVFEIVQLTRVEGGVVRAVHFSSLGGERAQGEIRNTALEISLGEEAYSKETTEQEEASQVVSTHKKRTKKESKRRRRRRKKHHRGRAPHARHCTHTLLSTFHSTPQGVALLLRNVRINQLRHRKQRNTPHTRVRTRAEP
jgi:hypothetical protein